MDNPRSIPIQMPQQGQQSFQFNQFPQNQIQMQAPIVPQVPYKPITFEKLSNFIGGAYNLSSLENLNSVTSPRGSEQQIFFVNNDEKIYTRGFDNSIGIIGYKQDYVQQLQNELAEAQSQLQEIFADLTSQTMETNQDREDRFTKLELEINNLKDLVGGLFTNELKGDNKSVESIPKLA